MSDIGKTVALIKALAGSGGGSGGVSDVKVAGTSVVSNGTANIPLASSANAGVMKINGSSRLIREKEKEVAKRAQMTSNCCCDTNKKEVKLCSKKEISQSS